MKKLIPFLLIGFILSGCSLFHLQRMEIEQGNIITEEKVEQLHPGMTEADVIDVMGNPVLTNLFTPDRIEYVYTIQRGYDPMFERKVTCVFKGNILKEVIEA